MQEPSRVRASERLSERAPHGRRRKAVAHPCHNASEAVLIRALGGSVHLLIKQMGALAALQDVFCLFSADR